MLHGTIQYHPTDRSKAGHPARFGTRRCRLLVMDVGADDFELMPSEDDLMDFSATKVQVTVFFSEQQCRIEPIDGEHGQFYSCYSWFIMFIPLSPH